MAEDRNESKKGPASAEAAPVGQEEVSPEESADKPIDGGQDPDPEEGITTDADDYGMQSNEEEKVPEEELFSEGGKKGGNNPPEDQFNDEESGKKNKEERKLNPKFQDLQETGRWGEVGKIEIIVGAVLVILAIVGVIVGVVLTSGGEDGQATAETAPVVQAPSSAPTNPPVTSDVLISAVVSALEKSSTLASISAPSSLPRAGGFYGGLASQETAPTHQRAMSWLLETHYNDYEKDNLDEFSLRFALASIYYQTGGASWDSPTNWLSSESVCTWDGVECEIGSNQISDLVLDRKNLSGSIPDEIALLQSVKKVWLSNNNLSGPIPGAAFGELKDLRVLYLNGNQLTGHVPESLNSNKIIDTLFVQENNLSGQWPFCPTLTMGPKVIQNFALDCLDGGVGVLCRADCCDDFVCY